MNRSTFLYNCKQCLRWGKKNLKQIFCSRMIRKIYGVGNEVLCGNNVSYGQLKIFIYEITVIIKRIKNSLSYIFNDKINSTLTFLIYSAKYIMPARLIPTSVYQYLCYFFYNKNFFCFITTMILFTFYKKCLNMYPQISFPSLENYLFRC